MKKRLVDVLVVAPGKRPKRAKVMAGLKSYQAIVEGRIEASFPFMDGAVLITNENGKCEGLPWNRSLKDPDGNVFDVIAGTFFVAGVEMGDIGSLTENQLRYYESFFWEPESFQGNPMERIPMFRFVPFD